ncbi:MAG: hypothetical protein WBQ73_01805 [Candidatus Babeliales bacterium]
MRKKFVIVSIVIVVMLSGSWSQSTGLKRLIINTVKKSDSCFPAQSIFERSGRWSHYPGFRSFCLKAVKRAKVSMFRLDEWSSLRFLDKVERVLCQQDNCFFPSDKAEDMHAFICKEPILAVIELESYVNNLVEKFVAGTLDVYCLHQCMKEGLMQDEVSFLQKNIASEKKYNGCDQNFLLNIYPDFKKSLLLNDRRLKQGPLLTKKDLAKTLQLFVAYQYGKTDFLNRREASLKGIFDLILLKIFPTWGISL